MSEKRVVKSTCGAYTVPDYEHPPAGILVWGANLAETRIGECRSDFEITNALAERLGLQDRFWQKTEELLDEVIRPTGLTFEEFRQKAVVSGAVTYRKYKDKGLNTPSGKAELYSNQLASWGLDPLPVNREPPEYPLSDPGLAQAYPLVLTTKKSIYYLHSSGRQIGSLRCRYPEPQVLIHPQTAATLDIDHGDWV